jgi:hypothetical protein
VDLIKKVKYLLQLKNNIAKQWPCAFYQLKKERLIKSLSGNLFTKEKKVLIENAASVLGRHIS